MFNISAFILNVNILITLIVLLVKAESNGGFQWPMLL